MSLFIKHKETAFGVGDKVKVILKIKDGEKERNQTFEGLVIAIKGAHESRTFTVRKIGVHNVGVERIFQLTSPYLDSVSVVKAGTAGVRRAKLYYTRDKSPKEVEEIYSRAKARSR